MTGAEAVATREREIVRFTLIPQLDKYPWLVSFGQTLPGKALLIVSFAVCLVIDRVNSWRDLTVAITLLTLFPTRRRLLISVVMLYWLAFHATWINWDALAAVALSDTHWAVGNIRAAGYGILASEFVLLGIYFRLVRTRRDWFISKRPVLYMVTTSVLLLAGAGLATPGTMSHFLLWTAVVVTSPYLWYFAYALKDASAKTADGVLLEFGAFRPLWGGSFVPYPKGAANLRKIEVKNPKDLCIVQLKAIKLLIWVFVLKLMQRALLIVFYGQPTSVLRHIGLPHAALPHLTIPDLDAAMNAASLPISVAWLSLVGHFAQTLLNMCIVGHVIIACCRMSGFNALRNTYKPLHSRTVAEFWNRYYYYFKELLVEFFFFPAFTRYFKRYRRIRVFAATVAAATFGNVIYHFLHDFVFVAQYGWWRAVIGFRVYFCYCTILGVGIGISQLRNQGKPRQNDLAPWWQKGLATTGVLAFFCLIAVFDHEGPAFGLGECVHFFLRLFFIPV